MANKTRVTCEACKKDGFFRVVRAGCPSCDVKKVLCVACAHVYVACSDVCRAKWRETCKKPFGYDGTIAPPFKKPRKKKGYEVAQSELFNGRH